MDISILLPASDLRMALAGLLKVAGKTNLSVSSFIRLTRNAAGVVTLQATDLDSLASYRLVPPQSGVPIELLIASEPLVRVAKNAKERVGILLEGEERVFLQSFVGSIPMEEPIDGLHPKAWPIFPHLEDGITLNPGFPTSLKEALACTGDDGSRLALSGVFIDVSQPNEHVLVGTDGSHLYAANSFCFALKQSLILPNRKFLNWMGSAAQTDWQLSAWLGAGQKPWWIQLTAGPWTFLTKTVEDEYPQWRNVLPGPEGRKTLVVLSERARRCLLEVVPLMPGGCEQNQPVTLVVTEDDLRLRGRSGPCEPWTEFPVPATTIIGNPLEVCLNRSHLLKALQIGLMHMELSATDRPVVFWNVSKKLLSAPLGGADRKSMSAERPPVRPVIHASRTDETPKHRGNAIVAEPV